MSLGSHGNDREVDRAQHLFCNRAKEHLSKPAPAPCAKKDSICVELPCGSLNLLDGMAFAHQSVAPDFLNAGGFAPGTQLSFSKLKRSRWVVEGQPNRID